MYFKKRYVIYSWTGNGFWHQLTGFIIGLGNNLPPVFTKPLPKNLKPSSINIIWRKIHGISLQMKTFSSRKKTCMLPSFSIWIYGYEWWPLLSGTGNWYVSSWKTPVNSAYHDHNFKPLMLDWKPGWRNRWVSSYLRRPNADVTSP